MLAENDVDFLMISLMRRTDVVNDILSSMLSMSLLMLNSIFYLYFLMPLLDAVEDLEQTQIYNDGTFFTWQCTCEFANKCCLYRSTWQTLHDNETPKVKINMQVLPSMPDECEMV